MTGQTKKRGRPKVPVDLEQALTLRREGKSLRCIAREVGCSKTTLWEALRAVRKTPGGTISEQAM